MSTKEDSTDFKMFLKKIQHEVALGVKEDEIEEIIIPKVVEK